MAAVTLGPPLELLELVGDTQTLSVVHAAPPSPLHVPSGQSPSTDAWGNDELPPSTTTPP